MSTHVQRVRYLYKMIFRLHRGLPQELKELGDKYVKEEFKRHKKCKPAEAVVFMSEWTDYAIMITKQLRVKGPMGHKKFGKALTQEELDLFKDDQLQQLYELMNATKGKQDVSTDN